MHLSRFLLKKNVFLTNRERGGRKFQDPMDSSMASRYCPITFREGSAKVSPGGQAGKWQPFSFHSLKNLIDGVN